MKEKLQELENRMSEVNDLQSAAGLLSWDQTTYMPSGGAPARARQISTLGRLAHEKFTDPAVGRLLEDLEPWQQELPYDSDDASMIRITRRHYERALKIPASYMARRLRHQAESYAVWAKARPAGDFQVARPYLEKTLEMSRELADFYPGYDHIADPLIDFRDYGMKASEIQRVFAELRQELVPLVQAITAQPEADDSCLHRDFPVDLQTSFFSDVIRAFGYDYDRGRQDISPHPFTTKFSLGDVRITVRYQQNDLGDALFSALHESGHAMYEQGINPAYEGNMLARGTSSGIHESQSRLWENIVGRSRNFWSHYFPKLQTVFPSQLGDVPLDTFYRAINKVKRSLIRVDADEVTYNLHVMIRFDLELALLEGKLAVRDLPQAWHERYKHDLGVVPDNNGDGVMQDMHWYMGLIGGQFQGYTLGNILSALFYQSAVEAHPEIPADIAEGRFDRLHNWLQETIYHHGRKFTASELVEWITGSPLRSGPYIDYLRTKYGELYNL